MNNKNILANISTFGNYYVENYLRNKYNVMKLLDDWWESLVFLFSHIFFQARKEDISEKAMKQAVETLAKYFFNEKRNIEYKRLNDNKWNIIRNELLKVIGPGKIGKTRDVDMTIECLNFIGKLPNKNIVKYSKDKVQNKKIHNHYNELLKLKQIGPKIASFYLRDIVMLFDMEDTLSETDYKDLQPIDTWVKKIAIKLNVINGHECDDEIRIKIWTLPR
jgi:hypothetical protein